jgi:beta-phosphoglucomutase-like phosphatase (HAD superfamily)
MKAILDGAGKQDAFVPAPGLKDFLLELKKKGIRIGLVTSGLHEKAWPEILTAFRILDMGDPNEFYDAIITAGFQPGGGEAGTLGELESKPHPWLYAEIARVGLGIPFAERHRIAGVEDSGAGVCSIRLAGFSVVGMAGGNIEESGTRVLCDHFCKSFEGVLKILL